MERVREVAIGPLWSLCHLLLAPRLPLPPFNGLPASSLASSAPQSTKPPERAFKKCVCTFQLHKPWLVIVLSWGRCPLSWVLGGGLDGTVGGMLMG